jgi:hypothetical protein
MQSVRKSVGVTAVFSLWIGAAACGSDGPTFNDAGIDARVDAPAAPAAMLPASITLATTDCGAMTQQTVTVMNTGTADLTYSLAFSDPAFSVAPASGMIAAGASATLTISVTVPQGATAGTALTATLTATTNLPGSPHTVPVTVIPRGAHITLTPPSVGFGQVEAGTTSQPSAVLVANTGNAPATVTIAAPGGEFNRLFGTSGTLNLAGGQSADASFTYAPTNVGADSGSSAITITGVHCGTAPTSIAITGTGAVTGGVLVQGTPVDFGAPACGATSSTATVTLMNTAEIAAQFTATFPTDPEGDHVRYSVSPASGTVPANSSIPLTVTRNAIALPFVPRAVNATLRIHVDIPTSMDSDHAVTQTLTGPFLTATPASSQDFGFSPVNVARSGPITINNTGNATATIQSMSSAPFSLALPAMVNGGQTGNGTMTYQPTALGTVTGMGQISTPGSCSDPVSLTFTAGDGPYVSSIYTYGAGVSCPVTTTFNGPVYVVNAGTQPLDVSCVDINAATNNLNAVFSPVTGLAVNTGGQVGGTISAPSPVRAGTTTTTVRCTTNEPIANVYELTYGRFIFGSDFQLSATAPLDFTCDVADQKFYTVGSASTSNIPQGTTVQPAGQVVFPLSHNFTTPVLPPNMSYQNSVSISGPSTFWGVANPCLAVANPGEVVFTGSVTIAPTTSGTCSVTPASLPVVLHKGAATAQ